MTTGVVHAWTGDLLEITLSRPERRNALGDAEWSALDRLADEAAASDACEFVVLRGTGDIFCAGVDLATLKQTEGDAEATVARFETNNAVLHKFEQLPQLLFVILNGPAIGIGVHFALMGDLVLARRGAYLWLPEAKLGIPDILHYRRLEERLGRSGALAMVLLGRRLLVEDALGAGLVGDCLDGLPVLEERLAEILRQLRAVPSAVRRAVKDYLKQHATMADSTAQTRAMQDLFKSSGNAPQTSQKSPRQ